MTEPLPPTPAPGEAVIVKVSMAKLALIVWFAVTFINV